MRWLDARLGCLSRAVVIGAGFPVLCGVDARRIVCVYHLRDYRQGS